jgi:hypothetical protein
VRCTKITVGAQSTSTEYECRVRVQSTSAEYECSAVNVLCSLTVLQVHIWVSDSTIFMVESKEELMFTPLPKYPNDLLAFAHHVAGTPPSPTLAPSLQSKAPSIAAAKAPSIAAAGDGYYDTHRAWCIRTLKGRLEFWASWARRYVYNSSI